MIQKFLFLGFLIGLHWTIVAQVQSSDVRVEWYSPEIDPAPHPERATLVISGRTLPGAEVSFDAQQIAVIKTSLPGSSLAIDATSQVVKATIEGYFELSVELPQGIIQIPIRVRKSEQQKVFLVTFDVSISKIKMNTAISKKRPPEASKRWRTWLGLGTTYQAYSQTVRQGQETSFVNLYYPSILVRTGYWGPQFGMDLFFRDAPGKINGSTTPYEVAATAYHWQTYELRGLYQLARHQKSRLFGLPLQGQFFLGTQYHFMPFLDVNNANQVTLRRHRLLAATLGAGVILGQERKWSYEASFDYQLPIHTQAESGYSFKVKAPMAFDFRVGVTYKFAKNWRTGLFGYLQTHQYLFTYTNTEANTVLTGEQNLFYSTLDGHVGYEF